MASDKPNDWENHYSILFQQNRDKPLDSLKEICSEPLFKQRITLFEFYRAAIQSVAWQNHDPADKSEMLLFYHITLYLYEITYRIEEMIKNKELVYSYKPHNNPN